MAEVRKSAKLTAARQLARTNAAQFREREDKLESLAVDYFTYVDQVEEVNALAEKEIVRVRAQAERNTADRRASAAATIVEMQSAGASRVEVAGRLGIAARDIKRAAPISAVPAKAGTGNSAPVEHRIE
ncbi:MULTISPECIES: hypothetical protein [Cryobacterium]|uniref:Helix-turn-helix domain-containing protein n=1 Tax=Cryobacterium breve TaxID=1259258 RepID=A0ABY2J1S5_9MICO|nr:MULTISPECIES: hypothetical protein [Cryobacterium]TFC92996.1 hypothetical protein E3T20_11075 [Cryobacterium sp. TmT3-12]TFC98888.1 hypothetical protein E3O65_07060 [Cryobacterium breve]